MRLGGRKVSAGARALDFHEALRATAHRTNLLPESRAVPSGFTAVTEWTGHGTQASHGRCAAINVARATMDGLTRLVTMEQVAEERGLAVDGMGARRG